MKLYYYILTYIIINFLLFAGGGKQLNKCKQRGSEGGGKFWLFCDKVIIECPLVALLTEDNAKTTAIFTIGI